MRTSALFVALCLLLASSRCWERDCRFRILSAINQDIDAEDTSRATPELTTAAANAAYVKLYDSYLLYDSDTADRVDHDSFSKAFRKAETNFETAFIEKVLRVHAIDIDAKAALVAYHYTGVCCYWMTPCISIKIGGLAKMTVPDTDEDPKLLTQSFAKQWSSSFKAVVTAKAV